MNHDVATFLRELQKLSKCDTSAAFLQATAALLHTHFTADVVIGYELLPETGGVPYNQPVIHGTCTPAGRETAAQFAHTDFLSDFIRHWQLRSETDVQQWIALGRAETRPSPYADFLASEQIAAFVFMPLSHQQAKLGMLLLHYTSPQQFDEQTQATLTACAELLGLLLGRLCEQLMSQPMRRKKMAVAHTLYGEAAVQFKGHIDTLQKELLLLLDGDIPSTLHPHLNAARNTVFEVMRNLVIEASGELLINLQTMSLSKALTTTAAALKRAWPTGQKIIIDIPPISPKIERQPIKLKQILYTLTLEAVGNAIKHGGPAPYIYVDISWENFGIHTRIIDHGQGFNPHATTFSEHGLGFWHHYINEHLKGSFRVISQPGGFSTVVDAHIPVIPARSEHVTSWV